MYYNHFVIKMIYDSFVIIVKKNNLTLIDQI